MKQTTYSSIEKLARNEFAGDWHDAPLRWQVRTLVVDATGNQNEIQKFSTKAEATAYARIRKNSTSFAETLDKWLKA